MAAKYGKIVYAAAFDLISGVTISEIMGACFGKELLSSNPTLSSFFYIVFEITLQMVLTLWISEEVRQFFLGENFEDPTGGILFILSVFRQPNFWKRVDNVADVTAEHILGFFVPEPASSNPDESV